MTEITVEIKDKRSATSTSVTANSLWNVADLKKKYAEIKKTPTHWQAYTFHNGTSVLMNNTDLLSTHKIINGSQINVLYEEPQITLQVRGLDGRTTKIDAYAGWNVRRLKEEYARWLGEGWDNVVLLYKAKRLKDEELLSVYNIEPMGFIQANVRSVGGD